MGDTRTVAVQFHEQQNLRFIYTNWRGETAERRVEAWGIHFSATEYHPEPQWILWAWDKDKKEMRRFAMRDMKDVRYE